MITLYDKRKPSISVLMGLAVSHRTFLMNAGRDPTLKLCSILSLQLHLFCRRGHSCFSVLLFNVQIPLGQKS